MNCVLYARRVLLVGEFRGMNSDHADNLLGKFFLDSAQGRDDVDAVDASLGPEIEKNDRPAVETGYWVRSATLNH